MGRMVEVRKWRTDSWIGLVYGEQMDQMALAGEARERKFWR